MKCLIFGQSHELCLCFKICFLRAIQIALGIGEIGGIISERKPERKAEKFAALGALCHIRNFR